MLPYVISLIADIDFENTVIALLERFSLDIQVGETSIHEETEYEITRIRAVMATVMLDAKPPDDAIEELFQMAKTIACESGFTVMVVLAGVAHALIC
jgi:hypothetical protein